MKKPSEVEVHVSRTEKLAHGETTNENAIAENNQVVKCGKSVKDKSTLNFHS